MRGFWADERVEWGIWKKKNYLYFFFKKIEYILYKKSAYIIVLCKDAIKEIVFNSPEYFNKVVVIPTCVDTNQFIIQKKIKNKEHTFVLCQVGSIQTRYLINDTIIFFKEFKKRYKSKLLIVNKYEKKRTY